MSQSRLLTESDIDYLEKRLQNTFVTKEECKLSRCEILEKLNAILGQVVNSRQAQTTLSHQVIGHEDRLAKLEPPMS